MWDKNGKYLYFAASTDYGTSTGWLDMSSYNRITSRSVYVVVLKKDLPSPLAPESDEEKPPEAKPEEKKDAAAKPEEKPKGEKAVTVAIDFDNISQRILALPIPARSYAGIWAGKTSILFLLEGQPLVGFPFPGFTLHKFELEKRKVENHGVAPDIEVELDPKALREGHDPQLEKAVEWLLDSLKKNPLPKHQRPAFPVYNKK